MDYTCLNQEQLNALKRHIIALEDIIKESQSPINGYFYHIEEYYNLLNMENRVFREIHIRLSKSLDDNDNATNGGG